MLAKPEYFSLPDEACCRPGRCGGEVGRYAAAESHREDVAGRGAVAELLVRAASGSSWRERRGRDGAKRQSVRKSLPLGERRCGGIEEELAAGRATMRLHRGKACRWARTMQLHQEGAKQHREGAKWQQSALYSIFIPVPQAPYCHSYHNKIQKGRVILLYRE